MQFFKNFLAQFQSPLILILLFAALVSVLLGRFIDGLVILVVLISNSIFGAFWETKAAKDIASLKKYLVAKAKVIISGHEVEVSVASLKIGDLVLVEAGDRVPADGVLTQANLLKIDESAITGESLPSEKGKGAKVFAGTLVLVGTGIFKVEKVGANTEIGKIAASVEKSPEVVTPLQKRIANLGKFLGIVLVSIATLTFLVGIILQYNPSLMFTTAVALAVASVPEGLPIAVTVVLATGLVKMAKSRAIVTKLASVEALGSVTLIATDKTGTLTQGEIKAAKVYIHKDRVTFDVDGAFNISSLERLLTAGVLCNNARLVKTVSNDTEQDKVEIIGDPVEAALLKLAEKFGIDWQKKRLEFTRLAEFPFDPKLRYMATLNYVPPKFEDFLGKQALFVKGAPTDVINLCDSKIDVAEIHRLTEKFARAGLRVLGFAVCEIKEKWSGIAMERFKGKLEFLGLVGFADEVRQEAAATVAKLKAAGVKVLMVTGDHELTAVEVAKQTGILANGKAVTWTEQKWPEILEKLKNFTVLARVPPTAKAEIVKKLQSQGEIVAMTGDGVNDGPALVTADVGVALGQHGTDVAKEAADIVLTDDNLAVLYKAVVSGRVIFENIKKIVVYLLSGSFGALILVSFAIFLGLPLPLLPAQIIWINLVTDSLPDIALAFEKAEEQIFKNPPPKNPQILDSQSKFLVFLIAAISGFSAFFLYFLTLTSSGDLGYARTITFGILGVNTLIYVFSVRSFRQNIWQINFFANKTLLFSVAISFLILILGIYTPTLSALFATTPLQVLDWLVIFATCFFVVLVIELTKYFINLGKK